MHAVIEQNIETNQYRVACYREEETPSGCTRVILFASTDDMGEDAAKDLCKRQNAKFKSIENDRRSN